MSENSPFDLIVESIGLESALKLAKDLGGYTFYIPKLNTLNITLEILELKKRGYKIIGKIEPKFTRAEEGVMAHFLNLGDNGFSSNPDSRLIAAVIDYDIELRECGEGIDEEDLADLVSAEVLRKREYAQGLKTPRTKEDFLERRARIKKAEEELYAAYRTILDSGAKVYEIHYAYPLGYAIKVQKEPAKILLEKTTYKYWDIVEKYVREQLDR